jgi:hypothetical protein
VSASDAQISFERDIKPLFGEHDRESMKRAFDPWSHDDVARNSDAILARLREGTMPCDGAWPDEQIALVQRWVDTGAPA